LLWKQIDGDWVEAVGVAGVDVWVGFVLFSGWVVGDVEKLIAKVVFVSDAMVVVSTVPYLSRGLVANGEGVAALDVLDALCCGLIFSRSDERVRVVGHDDEAVELEAAFGLMLEEGLDEEFGVGRALEVAMLLEGRDGDGVGALFLADGGHGKKAYPKG
jgi:hypothetical protein